MFDNFTKIPYDEAEADQMILATTEIINTLEECELGALCRTRWSGSHHYDQMMKILNYMKATKYQENYMHLIKYITNNFGTLVRHTNITDKHGLVINQENKEHFDPTMFPTAVYLENAQEYMKQSGQHFLRIFTVEDTKLLYVYTNKQLSLENMYKLLALLEKIYPLENEIYNGFLKACIDKNADKAREILNDYFNSEEILNLKFEKFKDCLRSQNENKIRNLEAAIDEARANIQRYENAIAERASTIRENSEKIEFLKLKEGKDEEERMIFKYLTKSPYIVSFKGDNSGYIELDYRAPIIYFNDFPAEKILERPHQSERQKNIVKIILGRKYQLMTKCKLSFGTGNYSVQPLTLTDNTNILRHPHIDRYNCFGNHLAAIREAAQTGNYLGALEQITQAVLNLNFYDACVINWTLATIENGYRTLPTWKCVETGEMLTTEQVVNRGDYYEETQSE